MPVEVWVRVPWVTEESAGVDPAGQPVTTTLRYPQLGRLLNVRRVSWMVAAEGPNACLVKICMPRLLAEAIKDRLDELNNVVVAPDDLRRAARLLGALATWRESDYYLRSDD